MKKQEITNENQERAATEKRFSRAALLSSKTFKDRRDILSAVLDGEKDCSKAEAEELIQKYMKKEMA